MATSEADRKGPSKTRYERWQHTIDSAADDPRWNEYDCQIRQIISTFDRHLRGTGYRPLDWKLIKAVIWTESGGPTKPAWRKDPMQIGNPSDPGLRALLPGREGGDLILPTGLAVARPGDSFDKFARLHQTTVEVLKTENRTLGPLRPGQTLTYQKASLRKVIVGWESITPMSIANRYNVGDPEYSRKLKYCLDVMRQSRTGEKQCAS